MSVQFGRWNFEGQPPAPDYVEKVSATLAPYGPDSDESYSKGAYGFSIAPSTPRRNRVARRSRIFLHPVP